MKVRTGSGSLRDYTMAVLDALDRMTPKEKAKVRRKIVAASRRRLRFGEVR